MCYQSEMKSSTFMYHSYSSIQQQKYASYSSCVRPFNKLIEMHKYVVEKKIEEKKRKKIPNTSQRNIKLVSLASQL